MNVNAMAAVAAAVGFACSSAPLSAASLQVSPVNLNVDAPGAATVLNLRNSGRQPFTAQVRVFRWVQKDGHDLMEPTNAVVASPPFIQLAPQQNYTVRIVRTSPAAASSEESYRVVVDELPPPTHKTGAVTMVARHVVPAFFTPSGVQSDVRWSLVRSGKRLVVQGANHGGSYLRLANARVRGTGGGSAVISPGLAGYILPGSTMQFAVKSGGASLKGQPILEAQSQFSAIKAPLSNGRGE